MGDRRYDGPEHETHRDELRRAWFDSWTEGQSGCGGEPDTLSARTVSQNRSNVVSSTAYRRSRVHGTEASDNPLIRCDAAEGRFGLLPVQREHSGSSWRAGVWPADSRPWSRPSRRKDRWFPCSRAAAR